MLIAYVAGPFRAPNAWGIAENVRAAERAGLVVHLAGAMPLIPHANTAHFHGIGDDSVWLDGTLELMRRCDVVVCLSTWERSSGARAEVEEAKRLNLPVYVLPDLAGDVRSSDIDALRAWFNDGRPKWSEHVGGRAREIAATARGAQRMIMRATADDDGVTFTVTTRGS